MSTIPDLLQALGATLRPGVSVRDIAAFELRSGFTLPAEVRALYQLSNGFEIEQLDCEFVSLDCVFVLLADDWKYAALTDQNDSNPYCVCCCELLNGYVVHVFHDDSPELEFRSIHSFLSAMQRAVDADECLEDTATDFDTNARSDQDIREARQLLALAKFKEEEDDYTDGLRFAAKLFSAEHLGELQEIMSVGDEYSREAVIDCLKKIGTPEALKLLDDISMEFKRFVNQCANRLYAAGFSATVVDETKLRLDPGPVWLNIQAFFDDRQDPTIFDRVIERAKVLLKSKGR